MLPQFPELSPFPKNGAAPEAPLLTQNKMLDSLGPELCASMVKMCRAVNLPLRTVLYEQGEVPKYGFFLCSGIASVVITMAQGRSAEVGLVGSEGLVGAMHILGPSPAPAHCFIQMTATALRIKLDDLRTCFEESHELRGRVLEFVQQQSVTLEQIAACNKLHEAEPRLARWLAMARDRQGQDEMSMTQEFLALMLGTRRTTVTLVAGHLQQRGLIEYRRGKVVVSDRAGLEAAACDCYRVTKQALDRLYK